jgi:hypothetical protein
MYPDHSCDAVFVELGTGLELGEPSGGIGPDHRTDHRGIRHAALRMCARLALLGLTVAQVATAQDGWRTLPRALWISGFGASAGLQSFGSSGSLGTLVAGPGYGIRLGWSGDSSLAVFVGVNHATLATKDPILAGNYASRDLELGARLMYPLTNAPRVVPFVDGALMMRQLSAPLSAAGQTALGAQKTLQLNGWGGTLSAGLQFFAMPGLALEASAGLGLGPITELRLDNTTRNFAQVTAATTSLHVGVSAWPSAWWRSR